MLLNLLASSDSVVARYIGSVEDLAESPQFFDDAPKGFRTACSLPLISHCITELTAQGEPKFRQQLFTKDRGQVRPS